MDPALPPLEHPPASFDESEDESRQITYTFGSVSQRWKQQMPKTMDFWQKAMIASVKVYTDLVG
jgi:hypothetical protein